MICDKLWCHMAPWNSRSLELVATFEVESVPNPSAPVAADSAASREVQWLPVLCDALAYHGRIEDWFENIEDYGKILEVFVVDGTQCLEFRARTQSNMFILVSTNLGTKKDQWNQQFSMDGNSLSTSKWIMWHVIKEWRRGPGYWAPFFARVAACWGHVDSQCWCASFGPCWICFVLLLTQSFSSVCDWEMFAAIRMFERE